MILRHWLTEFLQVEQRREMSMNFPHSKHFITNKMADFGLILNFLAYPFNCNALVDTSIVLRFVT